MKKMLTALLAGLVFLLFLGCVQSTNQSVDKAGGMQDSGAAAGPQGAATGTATIDEEDLPAIEDMPLTPEDAIAGTETY